MTAILDKVVREASEQRTFEQRLNEGEERAM